MSATRHATTSVTLDCNSIFLCGSGSCMFVTRHATASVALDCNYVVFVGRGREAVALLPLGTQLQVSPHLEPHVINVTASLWCFCPGREHFHVCH